MNKAFIFIVPNGAMKSINNFQLEMFARNAGNMGYHAPMFVEGAVEERGGFKPITDPMVHIWLSSQGDKTDGDYSDNWVDHGVTLEGGIEISKQDLNSRIPFSLLEGKKEGDEFAMTLMGQPVMVTCKQRDFRYGSFGDFEEVLAKVMA